MRTPKRRAYERPTLTRIGSFAKRTGIGFHSGPELPLLHKH